MAFARRHVAMLLRMLPAALVVCALVASKAGHAQVTPASAETSPPPGNLRLPPPTAPLPEPAVQVLDIRLEGNRKHTREQVLNNMSTRIGHPFDQAAFERDVRKLTSRSWFVHVVPKKEYVPGGVIITLAVVERPIIEYVHYFGMEKISKRKLEKETGLKKGDSFDPYAVREGARKIETLYQTKGYNDVTVDIPEGTKPGDRGVVYLIHEGKLQKFKDIRFEGNSSSIAPDGRLKKVIESREPIFWLLKGQVDPNKVKSDVEKLVDYYRSLGFFKATVGRTFKLNENEDRVELVFHIVEGPRYNVRNISFAGNQVYPQEALSGDLKLKPGDPFDQNRMNADIGTIKDLYGSNGYVFCEANADLVFLEQPGELDIVYRIKEDEQYRIGDIDVTISGDNPHTRHSTIRNRLSMRPGDIADIRQFRSSERRIRASGLFNVDPSKGELPRIVFTPPDPDDELAQKKKRSSTERTGDPESFRGQSPDPAPVAPHRPTWPARRQAAAPPANSGPVASPPRAEFVPGSGVSSAPRTQSPPSGFLREPVPQTVAVRAQSPDQYGGYGGTAVNPISPNPQPITVGQPATPSIYLSGAQPGYATPAQYGQPSQDPLANPTIPGSGGTVPQDFGSDPGILPPPGGFGAGAEALPPSQPTLPVQVYASEAQTGRFMLGAGINSNAGLVGSIILDEQNFDWRRWPTSWEDFRSGRAFRGAGQKFRIEAAPGTQVQRYLFNFAEPYMFDTPVSFGLSGYYFNRYYRDWLEQRLGGRVNLGYQFTPDLSGSVGFRGEDVFIGDPRVPGVPDLEAVLGHTALYSFQGTLAHDTRDNTFLPTEGHLVSATFAYFLGTFQYPYFTLNAQQHWLLRERPDGTGRHTFSYYNQLGFAGPDTPIYERFFAGGFSTLRGFQFRGASPQQGSTIPGENGTVLVGGDFMFVNTLEYMMPVTADDMFKIVAFVDFGTVEENIEINWDQFRIAPGLGMRITIPMISPAPIAVDFAVPVQHADGDLLQLVSFFVGVGR